MSQLISRWRMLENVTVAEGAFGVGPALWVGRREVAHFDADGTLDVRLTRQVIRLRKPELGADGRILLRPGTSDWLALRIGGVDDIEFAVLLVNDAVAANLPTAPPGLPPEGAELERRRRFH
jgi:Family of unknown function (DUF5519)